MLSFPLRCSRVMPYWFASMFFHLTRSQITWEGMSADLAAWFFRLVIFTSNRKRNLHFHFIAQSKKFIKDDFISSKDKILLNIDFLCVLKMVSLWTLLHKVIVFFWTKCFLYIEVVLSKKREIIFSVYNSQGRKVVLKNFVIFTGKHLCSSDLNAFNFIKKRLKHWHFLVNIAAFLTKSILESICKLLVSAFCLLSVVV